LTVPGLPAWRRLLLPGRDAELLVRTWRLLARRARRPIDLLHIPRRLLLLLLLLLLLVVLHLMLQLQPWSTLLLLLQGWWLWGQL
jgi:hypothetical protein